VGGFVAVTKEELVRARRDIEFKHQLLIANLDRLLTELYRLQRTNSDADPLCARQMREGVQLAVKLAERIREIAKVRKSPAA
jgi:hypothetical protein